MFESLNHCSRIKLTLPGHQVDIPGGSGESIEVGFRLDSRSN